MFDKLKIIFIFLFLRIKNKIFLNNIFNYFSLFLFNFFRIVLKNNYMNIKID